VKNKLLITAELSIKIFVKEKLMIQFSNLLHPLHHIWSFGISPHNQLLNAFITAMTKSIYFAQPQFKDINFISI
jgi:hypothetical protein